MSIWISVSSPWASSHVCSHNLLQFSTNNLEEFQQIWSSKTWQVLSSVLSRHQVKQYSLLAHDRSCCIGSGKTLAFLIPLLAKIDNYSQSTQVRFIRLFQCPFNAKPNFTQLCNLNLHFSEKASICWYYLSQAVIMVPTKELAVQIYKLAVKINGKGSGRSSNISSRLISLLIQIASPTVHIPMMYLHVLFCRRRLNPVRIERACGSINWKMVDMCSHNITFTV